MKAILEQIFQCMPLFIHPLVLGKFPKPKARVDIQCWTRMYCGLGLDRQFYIRTLWD